MIEDSNPIIAYKGFKKSLKSFNVQFKENILYTYNGELDIYFKGFHSCRFPYQVLEFYKNSNDNVFYKVAVSGKFIESTTSIVSTKIKLIERVDIINEIIKCGTEYNKNNNFIYTNTNNDILLSNGYKSHINIKNDNAIVKTTEQETHISSFGYQTSAKTEGNHSNICSLNNHSYNVSNGDQSHTCSLGDWCDCISNGYLSNSVILGDASNVVTYGDNSHAVSLGNSCKIESFGKNSLSVSLGPNSKVKSNFGIVLSNWIYQGNWKLINVYYAKIGDNILGTIIKKDIWYHFKNGKLISSI